MRDGTGIALGPNNEAILHALVLRRGEAISREELCTVLPEPAQARGDERGALKNALWRLRERLQVGIPHRARNVVLEEDEEWLEVDLWRFQDLVERQEYGEAGKLVKGNRGIRLLEEDADHNKLFKATAQRFEREKQQVTEALRAGSGRVGLIRDTRKVLEERTLVPGVGRQTPIDEIREKIEPVGFPWKYLQPRGKVMEEPLPLHLVQRLKDGAESAMPQRSILVGEHGAGKTLAAIGIYLQLTDEIDDDAAAAETRPVFYFDGRLDGQEEGFGTDAWFERRLEEVDARGHGRPIAILAHADAFFSRSPEGLRGILGWRMFRECDVLLCCSEQYYSRHFTYQDYGARVFRLEPWVPAIQGRYVSLVFGDDVRDCFEAWRDEDETGTRGTLMATPLHLTFVLPMLAGDSEAKERISVRWHLLDQVARMRLGAVAPDAAELEERLDELAAVAHRFYRSGLPADRPIGFNLEALKDFLRHRDQRAVNRRLDEIVDDSLVAVPPQASDEYRFEKPLWGWFLTARHLVQVLKLGAPPESPGRAFAKTFSPAVMELCEEMLCEELPIHEERILASLRAIIEGEPEAELSEASREAAAKQARHLLDLLGQRFATT